MRDASKNWFHGRRNRIKHFVNLIFSFFLQFIHTATYFLPWIESKMVSSIFIRLFIYNKSNKICLWIRFSIAFTSKIASWIQEMQRRNEFKKPVAMLYTPPSATVFQLSMGVECRINAIGVKGTLHLSAYDFNLNFSIHFLVEAIFTTIYQTVVDIWRWLECQN